MTSLVNSRGDQYYCVTYDYPETSKEYCPTFCKNMSESYPYFSASGYYTDTVSITKKEGICCCKQNPYEIKLGNITNTSNAGMQCKMECTKASACNNLLDSTKEPTITAYSAPFTMYNEPLFEYSCYCPLKPFYMSASNIAFSPKQQTIEECYVTSSNTTQEQQVTASNVSATASNASATASSSNSSATSTQQQTASNATATATAQTQASSSKVTLPNPKKALSEAEEVIEETIKNAKRSLPAWLFWMLLVIVILVVVAGVIGVVWALLFAEV